MRTSSDPTRRGAALLVVLATLVLATTASVTLMRLATTAKANQILAQRCLVADDMLLATEALISAWLESKSSSVVLPPDAPVPVVVVTHDRWVFGNTAYQVTITAWDQCAMVPFYIARSGSPLRLTLPGDIRGALDKVTVPRNQVPGLDLFLGLYRLDETDVVFPLYEVSDPQVFRANGESDRGTWSAVESYYSSQSTGKRTAPAIGACIATHGPELLNVNTAPLDVVEAALRSLGRGGLEQIEAARFAGRSSVISDLPRIGTQAMGGMGLTTTSIAWAFRIDLRIGSLERSWWTVYTQSRSKWKCVQRLAISE